MDYCMRVYGAKNSDRQIKNSLIPTESQFAKFNAHQIFPLYGIIQCHENLFSGTNPKPKGHSLLRQTSAKRQNHLLYSIQMYMYTNSVVDTLTLWLGQVHMALDIACTEEHLHGEKRKQSRNLYTIHQQSGRR